MYLLVLREVCRKTLQKIREVILDCLISADGKDWIRGLAELNYANLF